MEPTFIATPYVKAQSPASIKIRQQLDLEEKNYLEWREARKPAYRDYASKKIYSPLRPVITPSSSLETEMPEWFLRPTTTTPKADAQLSTTRSTASSRREGADDLTQRSILSRRSSKRPLARRPAHGDGLTTSASTPVLPRLSTASPSLGKTTTRMQYQVDEQYELPEGFECGLGKVHLQKHLYAFHSRQVFSFAHHPIEELDQPSERSEHPENPSPRPVISRAASSQSGRDAAPVVPMLSPTVALHSEDYVLESLPFMTMDEYDQIFEYDWRLNDVDKVVRDAVERHRIYVVLKRSYRVLLWFFRYYAGKSAVAIGNHGVNFAALNPNVDLFQVPNRFKMLEDLNIQCVDPARFSITEAPLKREGLIGFLLNVAKMMCVHPLDATRMRVLMAEGIEMSEVVKVLVRDHFGAYAQIQDVNHFRFVFLRKPQHPPHPMPGRHPGRRKTRRLPEIITKHHVNLHNFFLEQTSAAPQSNATGSNARSPSMKYPQFVAALKTVGLIPSQHGKAIAASADGPSGTTIDENRLLRVFLSCLRMNAVDGDASGTRETTFDQFVEALCRLALLLHELDICRGEYDVCPRHVVSEWCPCAEASGRSSQYALDVFDDKVEELFTMIYNVRLNSAPRKKSVVKMQSLRAINNVLQKQGSASRNITFLAS